ncbi:PREDICTED: disease resistance protein RPM1-like [Lupinus angustifolius]|uniref:disease resistance protein RPM1-like n=1 Tax=Lupinus angustifolius TaxID=3871 RepID=UPI00092EA9E0|nr:PREDICTED: disease resistance protein RPM1-like [Lupinus angustifolius]
MNLNSTGITNIIGLSYNDLPYHLKSCFLYFGIYPEDYEVGPKRLIRQWIAEGFVKPVLGSLKTPDKVGEQHLKELVDRNLVQVSSFSIDGKPKRCRVHDLLRDMILTKIEDTNFCHFASDTQDDRAILNSKIRRLQIATKSNEHLNGASIEGSLIRSLYTFRRKKLSEDLVKIIPAKCKRLKIFDFEDNWLKYIPENFGCLTQLRYLSFRNTKVGNIPEFIGNLLNLETLDLRGTYVSKLPKEINQLKKLQHLLYKHNISWNDGVKMMGGFAGLESLHTLHKVETSPNGGELTKELEKFMQLRCLGLVNVKPEYISPLYSSIEKMQYLEKLYISVSEDEGSIDWDCINSPLPMLQKLSLIGRLERFPKWIAKQESLVKLTLWYSNLTEDPLKVLSSLPKLVSLSLSSAYRGETLHFQNGGFQKLKRLVLKSLSSLNSIHINEGVLPLLKELVLKHIPELSKIPYGINHLNKLEVFDIIGMSEEFKTRVQENDLGKKILLVKHTH